MKAAEEEEEEEKNMEVEGKTEISFLYHGDLWPVEAAVLPGDNPSAANVDLS